MEGRDDANNESPEPELPLRTQVLGWLAAWAGVSLAGLTTWLLSSLILRWLAWPETRGPVPNGIAFGIFFALLAPVLGWMHDEKTWTRRSAPGWILLWMMAGMIVGGSVGVATGYASLWLRGR